MKRNRILSALCSLAFAGTFLAESFYPLAENQVTVKAEEASGDVAVTIDPVEDDYSSGDINGDGVINVYDYSRLNRYLNGTLEFDAEQLKAADFNYDRYVNEMDLYSMSEFITMYSEMPVNYNRRRLILNAKNFFLKYGGTTDIELSIKIPDDWEKNDLAVFGDGEKITEIPFSSLTEGEKCERGGHSYTEYTVSVPVPDYGDKDTRGFSVDLTVQMSGQESYPVMLNRAVENAEERIEKSCELLGDLSDYASKLPEGGSKEEVLSEMKKWIEANPDLEITSISNGMINFKTSYGINSFFEVSEENVEAENETETETATETEVLNTESKAETLFDMEEPDYIESNDILPYSAYNPDMLQGTYTADELLDKYLNAPKPVTSDSLTLLDPDVLLHAPCDNNRLIRDNIDDFQQIGNDLTANISNLCFKESDTNSDRAKFDEFIGRQYSNFSAIEKWDQYGTVIWFTHGTNYKIDGQKRTSYEVYECDDYNEACEKALELNDSLNNITSFQSEGKGNAKVSYLMDDMSIGVKYYTGHLFKVIPVEQVILIGSGTLMQILSNAKFPNTVFYFAVCKGASDDLFNLFLIDHGAAGVIGYYNTTSATVSVPIAKKLFELVFSVSSDGSPFSLQSAIVKADCEFNINPIHFIETVDCNLFYLGDFTSTATLTCGKYFYYYGRGTLKGRFMKNTGNGIQPMGEMWLTFYRYSNGKVSTIPYHQFYSSIDEGEFSCTLNSGYYLVRIVDGDNEYFIQLDHTNPDDDLGEIVIDVNEHEDDFTFSYVERLTGLWLVPPFYLDGGIAEDNQIKVMAERLENHEMTVADVLKMIYQYYDWVIYRTGWPPLDENYENYIIKCYNSLLLRDPTSDEMAMWKKGRENLGEKLDMKEEVKLRETVFEKIMATSEYSDFCQEHNLLLGAWFYYREWY